MNTKIKANFSGTRIKQLVGINRFFSSSVGKIFSLIFWLLGVLTIGIWVAFLFQQEIFDTYFGLDQILLALFLLFIAFRSFLRFFVKNPEIMTPKELQDAGLKGAELNVVNSFSVELAEALLSVGNDLDEASTSDILIALIKSSESNFIFSRLGKSKDEILSVLSKQKTMSGVRFSTLVEQALEIAVKESHSQIELGDFMVALAEADLAFSAYLSAINMSQDDMANIVYWQTNLEKKIDERHKFLDPKYLHLTGGIGKDWAYGYTPDLDKYSTDITQSIEAGGLGLELVGHSKEIDLLEQALNRNVGANAILVGEPGVGKKTSLLGFARKIDLGETLPNLAHRHVVELNVDLLISGLSGPGEFTQRLTQVFSQAANAGNIIIFIDGIEKILSSGEAGQIDATSVLIPYLSYPEINFIGTTDVASFNNLVAGNSALVQRFEKVEVLEPTDEEMLRILEDVAPGIECHFGVLITYSAIKEVVRLAKKYILDLPNPEKSISILEGSANTLSSSKNKLMTVDVVDAYVSSKANIPVKEAAGKEQELLINLESELKKRIVGQAKAVEALSGALKRSRAGVTETSKPIGSFLFVGPTGVGKTETAKALAEVYFGSRDAMIRFDMSEYQNKEDIYRLIGATAGSANRVEGELISKVRSKPFSLLLFDEIEKASPDILNLFLQILDEGFITSSAGRKVYFKNSIIIATSNAGANLIRKLTADKVDYLEAKKQVIDFVQNEGIFRPELINRFTEVVYYYPLSRNEITEVAKLMIRSLAEGIYQTKGIILKIETAALAKLSELGYDPEMGARPMARVIADQLENSLAEKILRGEIQKGSEVIFKLTDIK